ncbi:helix-turn-helix domain-containing protein [Chelatococcus reniformis]|uniref:HTH araC/xylS-type domain-containing protein n=1 Tax=Chelatococcus reniformis TaxID=1494448 RepID=A0A916UMM8_9HYPH|nr:AraC family transcriptional regulator [Chelatococcus reniformis]GGC79356.1 hypothetical protein GCM10010994_41790 [Chelatococcus reniformis]
MGLGGDWARIQIENIEVLKDAVYGAGLDAAQLSRAPVTGSLAFAALDDVSFATGAIGARTALTGCLSDDRVTVGLGLELPSGSRQWLSEVTTGDVAVFMPGDEHDALYAPGSLYLAVTLPMERAEILAEQHELSLDLRVTGSGVAARKLPHDRLTGLRQLFHALHSGRLADAVSPQALGNQALDALVVHLGRPPRMHVGQRDPRGLARVVARARAFMHANLDQPLSIEAIAAAGGGSRRTLHRAFQQVLDETPYSYLQKLRLHRIRHELLSEAEASLTIAFIANRWGLSELGRLAGRYRDLFGELPSQTRARGRLSEMPPGLPARWHN